MKYSSRLLKISLSSPCLASLLVVALASAAHAKESKPSLEPLQALPASNTNEVASDYSGEPAPLLLLAQAAASKAEAAQIAKSRYGGQVLSVRKAGNGWQVKLLLDDGRVKLVYVEGSGSDN